MAAGLVGALMLSGCGGEKLPSRDQIPVLRETLYRLEQAVAERNRAAIDSLLSVDILDFDQDSDSLLRLVYGPDGERSFLHLGDYEILYDNRMSLITCNVIDSAGAVTNPLRLYYKLDNGRWLLRKFEITPTSAAADSVARP
jgi:hypothetical protein